MNKEDELTAKCRKLASQGSYKMVFELLKENPVVLNYLTIGELSRYNHAGFSKVITIGEVRTLKRNIEKTIFGDDI
ncbi:MAG: hypothetical protein KJ646_01815 [Nanoarchaeota archaeon]|nr:hypothetical protein [Nanoarchaeota archaeon]MBU4117062.1 hypothetical protein [Nanoarchaeota archaeon]